MTPEQLAAFMIATNTIAKPVPALVAETLRSPRHSLTSLPASGPVGYEGCGQEEA